MPISAQLHGSILRSSCTLYLQALASSDAAARLSQLAGSKLVSCSLPTLMHVTVICRLKRNIAKKLQSDFEEWLEISLDTIQMRERVRHTQEAVQFLAGQIVI